MKLWIVFLRNYNTLEDHSIWLQNKILLSLISYYNQTIRKIKWNFRSNKSFNTWLYKLTVLKFYIIKNNFLNLSDYCKRWFVKLFS